MQRGISILLAALSALPRLAIAGAGEDISLPMRQLGAGGYYVRATFAGSVESDLLVDTGSSYVVLSRDTFALLKRLDAAVFQRTIRGATAAGRTVEAEVYLVSELTLGDGCVLRDVEAVALPSADRDILGLSALRRMQPFALQLEPAMLTVSACHSSDELRLASQALHDTRE